MKLVEGYECTYENIKKISKSVADNRLLSLWRNSSLQFSHLQYSALCQNLIQRLSPTAIRLSHGLDILIQENNNDLKPLVHAFEHNIADETGDGDPSMSHATLYLESCSTYSHVVYGENLLELAPLKSTMEFHNESIELFSEDIYIMLGACMAQETHALPQLENMYHGCKNAKSRFSVDDWNKVSLFYEVHLDGTEARHGDDLYQTGWNLIRNNPDKKELFITGYSKFIALQKHMWNGIEKELFPPFAYSEYDASEKTDLWL